MVPVFLFRQTILKVLNVPAGTVTVSSPSTVTVSTRSLFWRSFGRRGLGASWRGASCRLGHRGLGASWRGAPCRLGHRGLGAAATRKDQENGHAGEQEAKRHRVPP